MGRHRKIQVNAETQDNSGLLNIVGETTQAPGEPKMDINAQNSIENEILSELQVAIKESEAEAQEDNVGATVVPGQTDPEWSDYVLGLFEDNEVVIKYKDNKTKDDEIGRYPKVNGLRRLARKLIGEILVNRPVALSLNYNLGESTVACAYSCLVMFDLGNGKTKEYTDVGEVLFAPNCKISNNTEQFSKFPSAVAATRAEARALRKALGLNTIAYEEYDPSQVPQEEQKTSYITDMQKQGVLIFCKRNGVDPVKYILDGVWFNDKGTPTPYGYKDITKIQFSDGARMFKQQEAFQRDKKGLADYINKYKVGA